MSVVWPVSLVKFSKLAGDWPEKFWEVQWGAETDVKPQPFIFLALKMDTERSGPRIVHR